MQRLTSLSSLPDDMVTQYINQLLQHAMQQSVSDIHIEPDRTHCRIRFRQDGLLHEVDSIAATFAQRLTLTLKIMTQLNIAERRLPQDGRYTMQDCDVRISTCPTLYGEKIVLRLLRNAQSSFMLAQLGMTTTQLHTMQAALALPQGLILITGPTGCGKTMTLYAALNHLDQGQKNIVTIEDPIEISLSGLTQVCLNTHLGFNFPTVLRSVLRQDPDVLMIGEIRDSETAQLAIHAAQTGHLVLASLHTNSAFASISRLQTLGIDKSLLAETLALVLSQRLVRKVCAACQRQGCALCRAGYSGRMGIFEMISYLGLPVAAMTLQEAGYEKVREGVTSVEEIQRVLGSASAPVIV